VLGDLTGFQIPKMFLTAPQFKLIVQSSDPTNKAIVLNKIGGAFNIKVPEGGLVF
jgi:hypothetical protein